MRRNPDQFDLFKLPACPSDVPEGFVFESCGRALRVDRIFGTDAAAPVIVEELTNCGASLRGQFALYSHEAIARAKEIV